MRKYKKQLTSALLAVMLVCFVQGALASQTLLDTLLPMMDGFVQDGNTIELPVGNMYVLCGEKRNSGLMLDDMLVSVYDEKREWTWDAYWSGEWTVWRIGEMNMLCESLEQNKDKLRMQISNLPVDTDKYDVLSQRNGGNTNIHGLDSAYMHGKINTSAGAGHWEAYPFIFIDNDDSIYENAAYLNFRFVIPIDDETDQLQDFIVASQEKVAEVYKRMLELSLDINDRDRELMTAFVEYIDLVNAANGKMTTATPTPKPTPKPTLKPQRISADASVMGSDKNFAYEVYSGKATITGYTGNEKNVVIPGTIGGYPVEAIGRMAFSWKECDASKTLESVVIPDGVTVIDYRAFEGCGKLKNIDIPDSVTEIGSGAFSNCDFESIKLPAQLVTIGDYVFTGCRSLTSLTIPNGVKSIGYNSFLDCDSLREVVCPASLMEIGDDSFRDQPDTWIVGEKGSYAESYAKEHGIPFREKDMPASEAGYDVQYTYTIDRGEATITGCYTGGTTELFIPREIDGYPVTKIGNSAFNGYQNLTKVVLPEGIKSIGTHAFEYCTSLAEINIPTSVTDIGYSAMGGCDSLKSVEIPETVTNIGAEVLEFCDRLKEIRGVRGSAADRLAKELEVKFVPIEAVPKPTPTRNPNPVRFKSGDYEALDFGNGTCEIAKYIGKAYDISIPERLNGLNVVSIGDAAFKECGDVENVIVPDGVETLGKEAFYHCSRLYTISLPSSLKVIDDRAFYWCTWLDDVVVPESVTHLGNQAFDACENLTEINIPYSASSIGLKAFPIGDNLERIVISENHPVFDFDDGYLVDRDARKLVAYYGRDSHIRVPDGIEEIAKYAFESCYDIEAVVIPDSVKNIGWRAFASCYNITSITIPDSVTTVDADAFNNGGVWTDVNISNSCPALRYEDGCLIGKNTNVLMSYHGPQKDVVIPGGVKEIRSRAFASGTELTSVVIPEGVTSIGEAAFSGQYDLASVTLPDSLTSIGDSAFAWCYALESITIPEGVVDIGEGVFDFCDDFAEIRSVPGSAAETLAKEYGVKFTAISSAAPIRTARSESTPPPSKDPTQFTSGMYEAWDYGNGTCGIRSYNGREKNVEVPAYLNGLKVVSIVGLVNGGSPGANVVQSVTLPEGVERLGSFLFEGTTKLSAINIPASVKEIDPWAFTFIDVPKSIRFVDQNPVFEYRNGCVIDKQQKKLVVYWGTAKQVSIPKDVRIIGENAFRDCETIASLTIPNGVTTIEANAFAECRGIKKLTIPASVTAIGNDAFSWMGLTDVVFENSMEELADGLFAECNGLRNVIFPTGLKRIGEFTFTSCWNLGDMVIPEGVTSIGASAFELSGLKSIVIPESVVEIGNGAFVESYSLESITLPKGLSQLDAEIFSGCYELTEICGMSGSAAERLAKELGVNFIPQNNSQTSAREFAFSKNSDGTLTVVAYNGRGKKDVVIPDMVDGKRVTVIGGEAFRYNKDVERITLGKYVYRIGGNSFEGCSNLKELKVTSSLKECGKYAFSQCGKLKTVYGKSGTRTERIASDLKAKFVPIQ